MDQGREYPELAFAAASSASFVNATIQVETRIGAPSQLRTFLEIELSDVRVTASKSAVEASESSPRATHALRASKVEFTFSEADQADQVIKYKLTFDASGPEARTTFGGVELPTAYFAHGNGSQPTLSFFSHGLSTLGFAAGTELDPTGRPEFEQVSLTRGFDKYTLAAMHAVLSGKTRPAPLELVYDPLDPMTRRAEPRFWLTLGNSAFTSVRVEGAGLETSLLSYGQIKWRSAGGVERAWDLMSVE
jgi:hypothetical protein